MTLVLHGPGALDDSGVVGARSMQAEVGVELERDLGPKADGAQYSTDEVWLTQSLALRGTPRAMCVSCSNSRDWVMILQS